MKKRKITLKLYALAICTVCWSSPLAVLSQWSSNPSANTPICDTNGSQWQPSATTDDAGGVIVVWEDAHSENYDEIYAQRISADGYTLWGEDGIPVCTGLISRRPVVMSDGSGGVIVAWTDWGENNAQHIYAQRLDTNGNLLWTSGGVLVSNQEGRFPSIVTDDVGGAIISFLLTEDGRENYVYAQHIDANVNLLWGADGKPIHTFDSRAWDVKSVNDGTGGAIITFVYNEGGWVHIVAKRINSDGNVMWTKNLPSVINGTEYAISADGQGVIALAWKTGLNTRTISMQRIDINGSLQWPLLNVCVGEYEMRLPRLVLTSSGDLIVTWIDKRNGSDYDIYAQRVSMSGIIQWSTNGVPICTLPGDKIEHTTIASNNGSAIVSWRNGSEYYDPNADLYAQKVNNNGDLLWNFNGVEICIAPDHQEFYYDPMYDNYSRTIVDNASGGAIIVWIDSRNGNNDIYAQRVNEDGALGFIVTSHSPTQNALTVAKNTDIQVQFNLDVDQTTLNSNTFVVHASQTGLYTGTYSYNSGTKTATLNPTNDFAVGERVSVTLTTGMQTTTGVPSLRMVLYH